MDFGVFDTPRPAFDAPSAERIARDRFGVDGNATPLSGERDRSFKISGAAGDFVIKIGNRADHPEALAAQSAAVVWALERDPGLPLAEVIPAADGALTADVEGHAVQLCRFVAGSVARGSGSTPGLRRSVGFLAGRLSAALRGFDHAALHRPFPWTMGRLPELEGLIDHVGKDRRSTLEGAFDRFVAEAAPRLAKLPDQATHGDINSDNIVVDPSDPELVVGLFDFGDLSWGPRVVEPAIAATYQSFGSDPVAAMSQVTSAFHVEDPLSRHEIELLPLLIVGRCVQSLLMSARHVAASPGGHEYATSDDDEMWRTLNTLVPRLDEAAERLAGVCGLEPPPRRNPAEAGRLRAATLGPTLHLSYDEPVRPVDARGMWITESDGRRLLDAYNNVPQVGHGHPQVLAALAAQSVRLTTTTRYLVDGVAEYAARLSDLLPDPLDTVFFVNSGSEANDLAYRIAAAATGRRGVITTDNAYHGATAFTAAISPEELRDSRREPWTAAIPAVDLLADPDGAARIAAELDTAVARLDASGESTAMVILDTVFSSDGIFDAPAGLFDAVRAWCDRNGALFIADEVQAGFGRVGARFWGFAADEAVPDIVTLGKPMGNGHPMGAAITARSLAETFAARAHFFSTFAGSPVAAAVGSAVIDVIAGEHLAGNADNVGDYLRAAIEALPSRHIRDVRGVGLFVGVELDTPETAGRVVNCMRARGVLIGSTGVERTVLKIRPPLVCTPAHADLIAGALGECLDRIP